MISNKDQQLPFIDGLIINRANRFADKYKIVEFLPEYTINRSS